MGNRNQVLHFDYILNHELLGVYGQEGSITLYKSQGEGFPHIIMKLLSYFWFYHPDLGIEKHANQTWKPDLVRFNPIGEPVQWVDCGATKRHKLDRVSTRNQKTCIDIVKKSFSELERYKVMVERELSNPDKVRYFAPDSKIISQIEPLLKGRNKIIATITGDLDDIYITINDTNLNSPIHKLNYHQESL